LFASLLGPDFVTLGVYCWFHAWAPLSPCLPPPPVFRRPFLRGFRPFFSQFSVLFIRTQPFVSLFSSAFWFLLNLTTTERLDQRLPPTLCEGDFFFSCNDNLAKPLLPPWRITPLLRIFVIPPVFSSPPDSANFPAGSSRLLSSLFLHSCCFLFDLDTISSQRSFPVDFF